MMVVAILLEMMTAFNRGDVFFLGVIIWALVGIAVKNWGSTPVYEAAVASAILVLIIAIVSQIIKSSHKPV
jgi:divalent metal cation (Fe/Co/Zn/Cd) transporter